DRSFWFCLQTLQCRCFLRGKPHHGTRESRLTVTAFHSPVVMSFVSGEVVHIEHALEHCMNIAEAHQRAWNPDLRGHGHLVFVCKCGRFGHDSVFLAKCLESDGRSYFVTRT